MKRSSIRYAVVAGAMFLLAFLYFSFLLFAFLSNSYPGA